MTQNKNKKARNTNTADLVVRHAERHLVKHPRLRLLTQLSRFTGTGIFAFAGVCVMLVAFHLVNAANVDPTFIAENAIDYSSQQNFYLNGDEKMHAAANEFAHAQIKVREAALAAEFSRALNAISFALIALALWYLHRKHGIFGHNRGNASAGFTIRKIR